MISMTDCNKVYDHLADDESRYIFRERLLWSATRDPQHIHNVIKTTPEGREFAQIVDNTYSFAVWGKGIWGQELVNAWRQKCIGVVDNDRAAWGSDFLGFKVTSPSDFINRNTAKIMLGSRLYWQEMKGEALKLGLQDDDIICAGKVIDQLSKRQYFSLKELPHKEDEVFVDVGCFDGATSRQFAKWSGKFKKIICFEPDERNIPKAQRNLDKLIKEGKVEIINKGAWSEDTTLHFSSLGNGGSALSESGSSSVIVTTIDSALAGENVSFIKMDIEGAEYEALKGARECIIQNKPKLAICVYHKPEDIITLPSLILEMNNEYRFYLRHYSLAAAETVLYAI